MVSNILKSRIASYTKENPGTTSVSSDFQSKRYSIDQLFTIRELLENSCLWISAKLMIRDSVLIAMESIGKIINLTKICIDNSESGSITNGSRSDNGLSLLLFNIVLDTGIQEVNIKLEVFSNRDTERILAYTEDIDTVGSSISKTKEGFIKRNQKSKPQHQ